MGGSSGLENEGAGWSTGIVTAASRQFFPGLALLSRSVMDLNPSLPIACFAPGLDCGERRCAATGLPNVSLLPIPQNPGIELVRSRLSGRGRRGRQEWLIWACPFFIAASPFRRTLWLDCDIVVLRHLDVLLGMIDDGPVFTAADPSDRDKTDNSPHLLASLPLTVPPSEQPRINAGVIGLDLKRDAHLLEAYQLPVLRAAADPSVRELVSYYDQGALIWAIMQCNLPHRVFGTQWNTSVAGLGPDAAMQFRRYSDLSQTGTLFRSLRHDFPGTNILHWYGLEYKLWHALEG